MKKTVAVILKVAGFAMMLVGIACLVAGYFDDLKALCPKCGRPAEFDDYADAE